MGFVTVDPYDEHGRARNWDADWCIYAAFAEPGDGTVLVKIGISARIYDRLVSLRTACPFTIDPALWSFTGSRSAARAIERDIHLSFANRRTSGEWFRFSLTRTKDKDEFLAIAKVAYAAHTNGKSLVWKHASAEQLTAYASSRMGSRRKKNKHTSGSY